ncbi:XrtA/PEP-CTERM system histidine kinase PrsK [Marinobacter sp. SS21]|uniref:XrtA/PEP-CTERM system histidine kinase PrsK n=1 Tax=Marinobacter sp. SS21 TaxID=2979460 RepID=UPI002330BEA6|nr:XrtA/PEP-CTERM system histidine kinase PrsK [Marinobacter sp. SS21]MDC0661931.1 PEP-CTERM system histidine kinase PrsK [Marinobacter sp. SS21]
MVTNLSVISHGSSVLAFLMLAVLIASKYLRRDVDRTLFLAALVSALWAFSLLGQVLWQQPSFFVRYLLELLRDAVWIALLLTLLRDAARTGHFMGKIRSALSAAAISLLLLLLTSGILEYVFGIAVLDGKTKVVGQIALALLGLSLVEQIWRNAGKLGRSSLKYICIGTATLMAFDFFMYADALLFGQISDPFWTARGLVNALLVPLFAVNVVNTRKQPVEFQLSRSAVYHVGTLTFAGLYLIFLAVGGYYVKVMGGDWGEALQVLFITLSMVFFATLITSRRIRARLMIFISQNFFDYKYDYREQWLKMTRELANLDDSPPLPERVIRILAGLVDSNAGVLWLKDEDGNFALQAATNLTPPKYTTIDGQAELIRFLQSREWIINLQEYHHDPVRYKLLEIPDAITKFSEGWLIIPMYLDNSLYGLVLVGNPYAKVELNWENFDLIKVVARQTCNLLAQADAQNRLSRAMQFEAVNKASAFMAHDLKTLIAQMTLLANNAAKHRNNPAFIDDMIHTVEHATKKMSNLVKHIRKPADDTSNSDFVDLHQTVTQLITQHNTGRPVPRFIGSSDRVLIRADGEQLHNVLSHLIQNAQDATPPDGEITLTLKTSHGQAVLFIQDTGCGMTEDFIKFQLFKPFESTKGLTGMGIGAYQSREYARKIGGNIDVTSEPGIGSCFSVRLPIAQPPTLKSGETASTTDSQPYSRAKTAE